MGRRTPARPFDPEAAAAFLAALGEGRALPAALKAAGVAWRDLTGWARRDDRFRKTLAAALAARAAPPGAPPRP